MRRLCTGPADIPLRRLAAEFGVNERSIQRALEVLEELAFPIEHQEAECGKRFW